MSKRKKADQPADTAFDQWAMSVPPTVGCKTCSHTEAAATIRSLLEAMIRNKASHITLKQLHRKVREIHEDYAIGYWGFRAHLYDHERELYDKARGAI